MAISGTALIVAWVTNDPFSSGTTALGRVQYMVYDLATMAVLAAPRTLADGSD